MIYLSTGNTFSSELLTGIDKLNNQYHDHARVTHLFGSLSNICNLTCRSSDRLPMGSTTQLRSYIASAKSIGVKLSWTLNSSCIGNLREFKHTWDVVKDGIELIRNAGVDDFIVAHPLVLDQLKSLYPKDNSLSIEVSTVAEVDTIEKMKSWVSRGATSICGKLSFNRNFKFLTSAIHWCSKNHVIYRFMLNELCLKDCIDRAACYLLSSHNSSRGLFSGYPFNICNRIRNASISEIIKSPFILPQWIPEYLRRLSLDNVFHGKIVGRTSTTENVLRVTEIYMNGRDFTGDILSLWPGVEHLVGVDNNKLSASQLPVVTAQPNSGFIVNNDNCCYVDCDTCKRCQ